jgi:hypothetical protein
MLLALLMISMALAFRYIFCNKRYWRKLSFKVRLAKLFEIDIEAESHEKYKKKGSDANRYPASKP